MNEEVIAARALFGQCLIDGNPLDPTANPHLELSRLEAQRVRCDRILLVCSLEFLAKVETCKWIPNDGHATLAIYAGGEAPFDRSTVQRAIRNSVKPVWIAADMSPAGLAFALSVPRLQRVLAPSAKWLRIAAKTAGLADSFRSEEQLHGRTLRGAANGDVKRLWSILCEIQGIVQLDAMIFAPAQETIDLGGPAVSNQPDWSRRSLRFGRGIRPS